MVSNLVLKAVKLFNICRKTSADGKEASGAKTAESGPQPSVVAAKVTEASCGLPEGGGARHKKKDASKKTDKAETSSGMGEDKSKSKNGKKKDKK